MTKQDEPNNGSGDRRPKTASSSRKRAANRANAKKSTGPRGPGKKKSSRNATKAGLWAHQLYPITAGPFTEDESEFVARVTALIGDLEPSSELEHTLAMRAAAALIRLGRIDRYEAALIGASRSPDATAVKLFEHLLETGMLLERIDLLYGTAEPDDETPPWASLALAVRAQSPDSRIGVKGAWDADVTPDSEDGWRKVARSLVKHHWDSAESFEAHVFSRLVDLRKRDAEHRQLTITQAANHALRTAIEKLDRPRAAAWKEYTRAVSEIERLRSLRHRPE